MTMRKLRTTSILVFTLSALMTVASGCTVVSDGCTWAKEIYLDEGDKVSPATEDKIIAHNQKVAEFCR